MSCGECNIWLEAGGVADGGRSNRAPRRVAGAAERRAPCSSALKSTRAPRASRELSSALKSIRAPRASREL